MTLMYIKFDDTVLTPSVTPEHLNLFCFQNMSFAALENKSK